LENSDLELAAKLSLAEKKIIELRKDAALRSAAEDARFIDASHGASLAGGRVYYDQDRDLFVGAGGTSVAEVLRQVAADNTYLLRENPVYLKTLPAYIPKESNVEQSTTPVEATDLKPEDFFGRTSNAQKAQKLYKANPAEYRRLKEIARKTNLIG
jgi:hypothetical protein